MRSLRENHERPIEGNPCFFDRKSSVRKVSANGCPRCTLNVYRLKCARELKDRISKFKIHLSYSNGYVGEIFSIHWKT